MKADNLLWRALKAPEEEENLNHSNMKSRVSLGGLSKLFDEESEVSCILAVQALLAAPLFSSPQQMDPLV